MKKVALNITRHCMVCSNTYGCKDNHETRECEKCNHELDYCGSDWQDHTTGICGNCWEKRVRRTQEA